MASKAKLVTRTATSSSVTEDNIAKDAALTHAELDSDLINLRDQTIGIVGDDSATIDIKAGDSLYIQGGTNVTTATNSDGTITINASASGTITALNNATANELVTVGATTTELDAESGLTYDGSTLATTGAITATTNITATGALANDAVSITDNVITSSRSNDNLRIEASGTGIVEIGDITNTFSSNLRYHRGTNIVHDNQDLALDGMVGSANRYYNNNTLTTIKLDGTNTSSSHARFRQNTALTLDLNGSESTSTSMWSGAAPLFVECNVANSAGSSNLGRIGNVMNVGLEGYIYQPTSNITIDNYSMIWADAWMNAPSGVTTLVSDVKGFNYAGFGKEGGSGTETITKETAFYGNLGGGTTKYLIDTDADTNLSNIGTLIKYRETINALTASGTITVDCSLAPVHTVTLTSNTEFNINNLGTGQSVKIIITQDGGGNNTASWGTSGSTAVKMAGGSSTLSTGGNVIDVATIFNDGTNYIGNLALAYA